MVTNESNGQKIVPSPAFIERVLKGMGFLEPDQTLDALKLLPLFKEEYRGIVYRSSYAERVPTSTTSVNVRVDLEGPSIYASMDLSTLLKVVNFPN